jgi:hypothetical protein
MEILQSNDSRTLLPATSQIVDPDQSIGIMLFQYPLPDPPRFFWHPPRRLYFETRASLHLYHTPSSEFANSIFEKALIIYRASLPGNMK